MIATVGSGADFERADEDLDIDAELVQRYDELVPVLIGSRVGQPDQQLCHYFLDENAVKGFLSSHPA